MSERVVAIDNGAGICRVGFAGENEPRRVFPNCTAKPKGERMTYVGDMLLDCKDISALTLRRPFDRGYLVNWDLEKEIWSRVIRGTLGVSPRDCALLMTEPLFNLPQLRAVTEEVVFEELGFQALHAAPAPSFSIRHQASLERDLLAAQVLTGVVVDVGFSFTHAVPIFDGVVLDGAVRRLDIGGKLLTNLLKETVSYRSLNMQGEPFLLELIKDQLCFVTQDMRKDLALSRRPRDSPHRREYVLPDGVHNLRGYVRQPPGAGDKAAASGAAAPAAAGGSGGGGGGQGPGAKGGVPSEQVLVVDNERFMVPEALFHPADLGLDQAGVPELIVQAVEAAPPALHPLLYSNVLLTGGCTKMPGFLQRVTTDLRPLVADDIEVGVRQPADPGNAAWYGMSVFGSSQEYWKVAITKAEYQERGPSSLR